MSEIPNILLRIRKRKIKYLVFFNKLPKDLFFLRIIRSKISIKVPRGQIYPQKILPNNKEMIIKETENKREINKVRETMLVIIKTNGSYLRNMFWTFCVELYLV